MKSKRQLETAGTFGDLHYNKVDCKVDCNVSPQRSVQSPIVSPVSTVRWTARDLWRQGRLQETAETSGDWNYSVVDC